MLTHFSVWALPFGILRLAPPFRFPQALKSLTKLFIPMLLINIVSYPRKIVGFYGDFT